MSEEQQTQMPQNTQEPPKAPIRRRRAKKRVVFRPPQKFPVPVKVLWEQAGPEEREQAHRQCAVMLEYWLGRIDKQEVTEKLQVPPLRVWQLSQMALSGMLAGLLKQPRWRRGAKMPIDPEEDPKKLRKRIRELEEKLKRTEDLVRILRDLPGNRQELEPPKQLKRARPKKTGQGGKKRRRKKASASSGGGSADHRGVAQGDEKTPER